ncbi:MAG: undecaprenyldiphospho-muramoylpentapeptide beta-N-acetylglucosaminyltransferase [Alphaproteobacteria bacterium]|nr:undecaprenyldiphospho-muramoylpentapeptide beta-N-acetylglucosaminyltransferase [Alphaproteobacteria bacterium]
MVSRNVQHPHPPPNPSHPPSERVINPPRDAAAGQLLAEEGAGGFDYTVVLGAGGTGGHLFPAIAIAKRLSGRQIRIVLITDVRGLDYAQDIAADEVFVIQAAAISGKGVLGKLLGMVRMVLGYFQAQRLLKQINPSVVVGFGGYATVPVVMSAIRRNIPSLVHEQNAVLGRANRVLAGGVDKLALSFEHTASLPAKATIVHTGIPVRTSVLAYARQPYVMSRADSPFVLLVFGGSQGARRFATLIPEAITLLSRRERQRLHIVQQARQEDVEAIKETYKAQGLRATVQPFFDELPQYMAQAQLVISRAGAMTIGELSVIGRPAILIPLPNSIDNHQLMNAERFVSRGAGWMFEEKDLLPSQLAERIESLMNNPEWLAVAASCAIEGIADSTDRLAEQVLRLIVENQRAP